MSASDVPSGAALLTLVAPYDQTVPSGAIFGGWIMSQLDHAAGLAARQKFGPCIIRSFKEITFHAALQAGEAVSIYAKLTRTGNTSAGFSFEAWSEVASEPRLIASAQAVLVAIDGDGKPRSIAV